jgi:hypothetical protein
MKTLLSYCPSLTVLTQNLEAMYNEGRYLDNIKYVSKGFGGEKHYILVGSTSKTAVVTTDADDTSLCYLELAERDIIGDATDADYVPLIAAVGLECLAYGTNRGGEDCPYYKVENDPWASAIYEKFYPKRQPTDEEGNPVGDPVFNKGVELARSS